MYAPRGVSGGRLRRRRDREQGGAGTHHRRAAQHGHHAGPARFPQLVEEHGAPEDAEQAVGVPQRKRDAQADVLDRVNGERVGDGPQAAGEHGPDHEMRRLPHIGPDRGRAPQQRRETPARQEHAHYHRERDHDGRETEHHHLGGRFGGAEPGAGGEAAGHAGELQAAQARRVEGGGGYRIHMSTSRPPNSTATGTQN